MRDVLIEFWKHSCNSRCNCRKIYQSLFKVLPGKFPKNQSTCRQISRFLIEDTVRCDARYLQIVRSRGVIPSSQSDSSDANIQRSNWWNIVLSAPTDVGKPQNHWRQARFRVRQNASRGDWETSQTYGAETNCKARQFSQVRALVGGNLQKGRVTEKRTRVTSPSSIRILK